MEKQKLGREGKEGKWERPEESLLGNLRDSESQGDRDH